MMPLISNNLIFFNCIMHVHQNPLPADGPWLSGLLPPIFLRRKANCCYSLASILETTTKAYCISLCKTLHYLLIVFHLFFILQVSDPFRYLFLKYMTIEFQ
jgi:hypothetical protein